MEQSKAHANANVVTVIMKDKGIELQSAVDFLFSYLESLGQEFLNEKNILSSRLDLIYSRDALKLVEAIEVWMKGYDMYEPLKYPRCLIVSHPHSQPSYTDGASQQSDISETRTKRSRRRE